MATEANIYIYIYIYRIHSGQSSGPAFTEITLVFKSYEMPPPALPLGGEERKTG